MKVTMALTLDGLVRALRARAHGLADALEAGATAIQLADETSDRAGFAGRRAVLKEEGHERRD